METSAPTRRRFPLTILSMTAVSLSGSCPSGPGPVQVTSQMMLAIPYKGDIDMMEAGHHHHTSQDAGRGHHSRAANRRDQPPIGPQQPPWPGGLTQKDTRWKEKKNASLSPRTNRSRLSDKEGITNTHFLHTREVAGDADVRTYIHTYIHTKIPTTTVALELAVD